MKNQRVSLRSHEKEIRGWVADRKTDEWIARALGSSASSVQSFRSRKGIFRSLDGPDLSEAEEFEGTVEHVVSGGEGEGVWLDPAVSDASAWSRWRGVDGVEVRVSAHRLTIIPVSR